MFEIYKIERQQSETKIERLFLDIIISFNRPTNQPTNQPMTSVPIRITFKVLPAELENTIWSYLTPQEKYPYTRVLTCAERRHVPELKHQKLALRNNERNLLFHFANVIYTTFIDSRNYTRDSSLLPKYVTTHIKHDHPVCSEIRDIIRAHLCDAKTNELAESKCTPNAIHHLLHYFTTMRLCSKQPWAIKFNRRMDERVYNLTLLYRVVMKKFCKLRRANNIAFAQQVAFENEQRKKQKDAAREAIKQQKIQANEAAKQEKIQAKESAKQQKIRAKEAAKQEKLRAREAAKAELIAMKQADKEAKKNRKNTM